MKVLALGRAAILWRAPALRAAGLPP